MLFFEAGFRWVILYIQLKFCTTLSKLLINQRICIAIIALEMVTEQEVLYKFTDLR